MVRSVLSRRAIFLVMTGVCVLGLVISFSNLNNFTLRHVYNKVSNLTDYRSMDFFNKVLTSDDNNSHIVGQSSDRRLPDYVSGKGSISHISATKSSGILQNQTTAPATAQTSTLAEVHTITTTMTFNKSLEVACKESPYIECVPPIIKLKSEKVFKVSMVRQPTWYPISSVNMAACRYSQCQFVETTVTKETDLVVVYGVGLRDSFKPPQQRWSHQLYAINWLESPVHTYAEFLDNANSLWNHQFNITMNYRVDSDYFFPYGILVFNPRPLEKRPNYYEIAKNKSKTAAWLVSNCHTPSRRDKYVKEMQNYIDVDIIGGCGRPCSKKYGLRMCDDLPNYKFYLSFENSLCTDYVTEKFFKIFHPEIHVIPVVRGGADYDKFFPNFTFINAAHFKTAKDLALHLKNLASDLETYSKYLEYKDLYENLETFNFFCEICHGLHTNKTSQPKTYNLKTWAGDGHCHPPQDL